MKIFKSKIFYIILIVIFTLILTATLIIRFAIPSGRPSFGPGSGFGTPPGFSQDQDSDSDSASASPWGTPPSFDGSSDFGTPPDFSGDSNFTFPEGSDFPSDFQRPGRSSADSDKSSTDSDDSTDESSSGRKMPGNFDPSSFSSLRPGSRSGNSGFLGTVRKIWIPIVTVCVLVDAFAVFMLIRLSKKKGSDNGSSGSTGGSDSGEEAERRSKKPLLFLLLIPVLAIAIVLKMIPAAKSGIKSSVEVKENVITAEAANKALSRVFLSGGSLSEESAVAYSLPGNVEILSYAVSNGDTVEEGDLIARVNKTSVLTEISGIKDLISDLDKDLATSSEEDDYKKITSPASGRVKAIYALNGTSVTDTMASDGALILLSLDGLMKVEFTSSATLNVGDTVVVRLSDETEKAGRVAAVSEGSVTVTLTDKKTDLGDKVTVLTEDGAVLGTGELEINSCLKITGYQGLTNKVLVEVGDYIDAGDEVISLASKVHSTDYVKLTDQREVLTEQMNTLFALYETGEIRAERSGIISGLDEDITVEAEAETPSKNAAANATPNNVTPLTEDNEPAGSQDKTDPTEPAGKSDPTEPAGKSDPTEPAGNTDPTGSSKPADTTDPTKPTGGADQTDPTGSDQTRPSGNFPTGDFPSGSMPSGTGTSTDTVTDQNSTVNNSSTSSYTVSETEMYKILPCNKMTIDISVDELDIGALKVDQDVTVSLDALPGQSFDGTVVAIGSEGTYSSGNTKYTVTVEIERTEQMYTGMNAGIKIDTGDSTEYLTVPAAALIDEGGKTYVYTGYDEENDELLGLTEITTGLSDGENVEILSGISAGDKVCYRYADTIEYSFMR